MNERYVLVDGHVQEKGPAAIVVTSEDLQAWKDAEEQHTKSCFWYEMLRGIYFMGAGFILLIPILILLLADGFGYASFTKAILAQLRTIEFDVIVGCAVLYLPYTFVFVRPRERRAHAQSKAAQEAILSRYGKYHLSEVVIPGQWGWQHKKYALIAQE